MSVDDLHHFLESSLKSMGSILDVSRIFLFPYQRSSRTFSCICEWVAEDIATLEELDELTLSIPWGLKQLKAGHVINFRDIRDMPGQQYKERLLAAHVKSTLNVPLFIKGNFYGFMGFDECRHHRKWIDEDIYILTTAAQIITRAIENKITMCVLAYLFFIPSFSMSPSFTTKILRTVRKTSWVLVRLPNKYYDNTDRPRTSSELPRFPASLLLEHLPYSMQNYLLCLHGRVSQSGHPPPFSVLFLLNKSDKDHKQQYTHFSLRCL